MDTCKGGSSAGVWGAHPGLNSLKHILYIPSNNYLKFKEKTPFVCKNPSASGGFATWLPHRGFTLDPLGALRQTSDPPGYYCDLPF
jgi:hypothetical protein